MTTWVRPVWLLPRVCGVLQAGQAAKKGALRRAEAEKSYMYPMAITTVRNNACLPWCVGEPSAK